MDDDETRLYRTAVAQVFAFILQSLRARPPPETWHDEAETLGIWDVEFEDILRDIPPSERKRKEPRASPYKPQRWKGFQRSPIRTRSSCQQPNKSARRLEDDDEDPPSPTPNPPRTGGKAFSSADTSSGKRNQGRRRGQQKESGPGKKPDIQSRPFCTQRCLLGLAYGGPMDKNCPNAGYHGQGQKRMSRLEFLRLVRHQLAVDRGRDADCVPLHRSGSRGSLFKVRLTSHGYTLVAKGVEGLDLACLQHENDMYDRLQPIQGKYVPVCLGTIGLVRPYYYDSGVYTHFMFLSWAGQPIFDCVDRAMKAGIGSTVSVAFKAIHNLRVLHHDAEPRNILYDTTSRGLMVVDFERAEFHGRQPLAPMPNENRKRKRQTSQKPKKDDFVRELEYAVARASSCIANLPNVEEP
ncbi:hypothetical protein J3459_003897 [Metarhizium acridum]|nr:hypothetical protein J3459_003897 [Metarhizium acridum]